MPQKRKIRRRASRLEKIQTNFTIVMLMVASAGAGVWLGNDQSSQLAQLIRQKTGLPEPPAQPASEPALPAPPPAPAEILPAPATLPEPVEEPAPEPAPVPDITIAEIAQSPTFWPKALELTISREVTIRYNGQQYGVLKFTPDMRMEVDSLNADGEVDGSVNGTDLTLSLKNTNFIEWFESNHGERLNLMPIPSAEGPKDSDTLPRIGTPEGETAFQTDLLIWCKRNYDSVLIEVGADALVFYWEQENLKTADYEAVAREIAASYLKLRAKYGSDENYAACEVRHPETKRLLGTDSVFKPQL